jgi:Cytochrome P450
LDELDAGGHAELDVDVREVGLHVRGEMKSRAAMSLLPSPSRTRPTTSTHPLMRRDGHIGHNGPHGPHVLSDDLVRRVLRDDRFITAHGLGLDAQGVTSGALWDRATSNILGLDGSPEDWQLISDWVDDIKKLFEWNVVNDEPLILAAWNELDAYLEDLISQRRASLTDDLISDLIRAEDDGDRLTHDELLMLCATLLGAGTDTTRNQLAAAIQVLAAHPDQWNLVARHPELAPDAVHELMRYNPIIFGTIRRTAQDIELAGVHIPAGTLVAANTASANRDPDVNQDPERLDITRGSPLDPELRRWRALLPRLAPRAPRTNRSASGHHQTHAQSPPNRPRAMERDGRHHRAHHPAAGVRRRALNFPSNARICHICHTGLSPGRWAICPPTSDTGICR